MSRFIIVAFMIDIEFCSALWNYVRNVVSSNYVRRVGWSLARRNSRAILGRVHFPALSIIYSNYYQCLGVVQIKHGGQQAFKRRARRRWIAPKGRWRGWFGVQKYEINTASPWSDYFAKWDNRAEIRSLRIWTPSLIKTLADLLK